MTRPYAASAARSVMAKREDTYSTSESDPGGRGGSHVPSLVVRFVSRVARHPRAGQCQRRPRIPGPTQLPTADHALRPHHRAGWLLDPVKEASSM